MSQASPPALTVYPRFIRRQQLNDTELVQAKRKELVSQATTALTSLGEDAPTLAMSIVDQFCQFVPPEIDTRMDLVILQPGGFGGARSRKAGNILLNWRRLILGASESILAAAGLTQPWLIPLAALVIWNTLWSTIDIAIDEHHAAVLWALWSLRDKNNHVRKTSLPVRVNERLAEHRQAALTPKQVQQSIADLERMKCLESADSDVIWLREWVRVRWD